MTALEAAGERFLAVGDFMWMEDIAKTLREELGDRAKKVPTQRLPDFMFRLLALFIPVMRSFTADLERKIVTSSEKARNALGFSPRNGKMTVLECAKSLLAEDTKLTPHGESI
jgi:hypothetical protein